MNSIKIVKLEQNYTHPSGVTIRDAWGLEIEGELLAVDTKILNLFEIRDNLLYAA